MNRFICLLLLLFCTKVHAQKLKQGEGLKMACPLVQSQYDTLIDHGIFYPATTMTPYVRKYQNFKHGWLINFNMNVFSGSFINAVNSAGNPPSPAIFNVPNVNVSAWADSAVSNGVDYVVFTIINEYGFKLWHSETPYNMESMVLRSRTGGFVSPYYQDYSVQTPADTVIVQKICSEFRSRGIEPIPYINSVTDFNVLNGAIPNINVPIERQNEYINYISRLMQEMIIRFGFKYIWIDYAAKIPDGLSQSYYNAVKSADSTCQVIGNALGETNFSRFPYDIESTEEHSIYSGSKGYQSNYRIHNGTAYHVGQEIVATPYSAMSQWYYYDSLCTYFPKVNPFTGTVPWYNLQETDPTIFQEIVNSAKTYNRPFLSAVLVDRYGNLLPTTLNYLRKINFKRY